jgi:hypothetical protein
MCGGLRSARSAPRSATATCRASGGSPDRLLERDRGVYPAADARDRAYFAGARRRDGRGAPDRARGLAHAAREGGRLDDTRRIRGGEGALPVEAEVRIYLSRALGRARRPEAQGRPLAESGGDGRAIVARGRAPRGAASPRGGQGEVGEPDEGAGGAGGELRRVAGSRQRAAGELPEEQPKKKRRKNSGNQAAPIADSVAEQIASKLSESPLYL